MQKKILIILTLLLLTTTQTIALPKPKPITNTTIITGNGYMPPPPTQITIINKYYTDYTGVRL